MKRLYFTLMVSIAAMSANAQYQIGNSDFEQWESVSYSGKTGEEPLLWSSFLDGTGSLKSMAGAVQLYKDTETRPGSTGSYSAKLTARQILTFTAQGNLTTGCVNMGSMKAADASGNYNYINESRTDQSMRFTGRPDAVRYWVRFSGTKNGKVAVILTTKGYYQDPEANDITATVVASSVKSLPSNDTWTEYTVPFEYKDATQDPYYVLVNVSTSETAGSGNKNDYMYIDDMEVLYYSELTEILYDGKSILGKTSVDAEYDESLLSGLQSNGAGATIAHEFDESTHVLTVTVTAQDNSSEHTYTYQFNAPGSGTSVTKTYKEVLYVGVDGGEPVGPMDGELQVTFHNDNTIDLGLYNFVLEDPESPIYVGNIVIDNVPLTDTGHNYSSFEFTDEVDITAGTDPADAFWIGPMLGTLTVPVTGKINDERLYVTIKLYVELLGQNIDVILGDKSYFDALDDGQDPTGIVDFVTEKPSSNVSSLSCYDLQGRRANPSAKGIHIVNGKLVLKR